MTTTQLKRDLDQELTLLNGNKEAMQRVLDATRRIRLEYVVTTPASLKNKQKSKDGDKSTLDSLFGCWNDPEGEELYEFMRHVREGEPIREICLD